MDFGKSEVENIENRYTLLAGIDEVGRGPIAGPVLACAIIMPKAEKIAGICDSKKLSEKKREALYPKILEASLACGLGWVFQEEIDQINIRQATLKAMQIAYLQMEKTLIPDMVVIDYERLDLPVKSLCLPKADDLFYCVSCASIVAKVTRDHYMMEYGKSYPAYQLEKNKGYGTKAHYEAIRKYGLLPIHRKTFIH